MGLMTIILVLILLQYISLGMKVGGARMKYDVKAPAVSGHPEFERHYRVHQNTLEQLIVFVPLYLVFPNLAEAQGWPGYEISSVLGALFIIGRFIYAKNYVKDPDTRAKGFLIGFAATALLALGVLAAAVMSMMG